MPPIENARRAPANCARTHPRIVPAPEPLQGQQRLGVRGYPGHRREWMNAAMCACRRVRRTSRPSASVHLRPGVARRPLTQSGGRNYNVPALRTQTSEALQGSSTTAKLWSQRRRLGPYPVTGANWSRQEHTCCRSPTLPKIGKICLPISEATPNSTPIRVSSVERSCPQSPHGIFRG